MENIQPSVDVDTAIQTAIRLSQNELQQSNLVYGAIVHHDMFDTDLTVINADKSCVTVSFYNKKNGHTETAILPIDELYYPDLAAGALILQLLE